MEEAPKAEEDLALPSEVRYEVVDSTRRICRYDTCVQRLEWL